MNFSIGWMVCTGPDRSHVYAEKLWTTRRDALRHFEELKSAGKPCAVYRHTWQSPFSTRGDCTLVASANLTPQPNTELRRPAARGDE